MTMLTRASLLCIAAAISVRAGTPIAGYATSFEASEGYATGDIHGQQGWLFLNASNNVSASVVSSLGHQGSQSVVLSNAFLATEYTFKLRRSIGPFAVKGSSVAASLFWTPLSGDLRSKAGWGISSTGSDYLLVRGDVYSGSSWIGVRHNSLETSSSSSGTGVNPAFLRWNNLDSVACLSKVLITGEIISTFSNVLSNTGGRYIFKKDAWVEDVDFTAAWIDIQVAVKPQSSVALDSFSFSAWSDNQAPTDITLSNTSIAENQPSGTAVGTLSTADPDAGNTFTYTLVSGTGSGDNGSFAISGNTLRTAASFNYETKSSYSVRLRTTDQGGAYYEEAFTITVSNVNETPTNITLSNVSVAENQPSGTAVGTLSTADPDAGNTFTYTLVSGTGSGDNGSFAISGNTLRTAASFDYEAKGSYSIRIRSTDQGGLLYEKAFTITVTDVIESCVVTFSAAGGTVSPTSKVVTFGSVYGVLPTPTRTGYAFSGWWTGEAGAGTEVIASTAVASASNHTLYAKWAEQTTSSPVPVPYSWINQYPILLQVAGGNYEVAALIDLDLDGHLAWQEYVAGTSPTDKESVLRTSIEMIGGTPWITWTPDLGTARVYTVEGRTNANDNAWGPTNAGSRFFKVRVDMP